MSPTRNAAVLFNEIPNDFPVPGKTTKYDESSTIDLDNVSLGEDGVLVKTVALSIDPYLRSKMRAADIESYQPPYLLGKPLNSLGVGRVVRSQNPKFKAGERVYGLFEHQEYNIFDKDSFLQALPETPLSSATLVGAAGMPGGTAYIGYKEYAQAEKGKTIFISTGAGAVGSVVGQLAKLDGLKVIGSAGSDEKVEYMKSLGFDVAFNYKKTDTLEVLKKEGPIDIYWENVGGATLDAAIETLKKDGIIIVCGQITAYNGGDGYNYKNLWQIFARSIHIHGFLYFDLMPKWIEQFSKEFLPLIEKGIIKHKEEVVHGLDKVGDAILRVQKGENKAKSVVLVADDKDSH
ncbi:NAD-P-binding protein [Cylindrobasidium torrendii FP15055 ss-10]|uniref:NAD-P-binding protein n=1 Tax=Cylindrobasidium torrendii FP15055 ss-10 TaxID=1314674 RepID=A0A0D7BSI5_9AGAR|nr:NAD-P-binding protein [Cylindrobasidium torrendii FP15055 ss-10]